MGPISLLIKVHLILIFLLIVDILMSRSGSKKGGNCNYQQNGGNYTNGCGSNNYQSNVYQSDYTQYYQTSNDCWSNTGSDYSSSAADSGSYYNDGLDVYRDYDPYL